MSIPRSFMHRYQMTHAKHMARKSRTNVRKTILALFGSRTERVFLPETDSIK